MTQQQELSLFAGEVGKDVKSIMTLLTGAANIVNLAGLKTDTKANLVAALNEVFDIAKAASGSGGAPIDDAASSTSKTYSSSKIESVSSAKAAALISDGTTASTTTWSSLKINNAIGVVATQVQTILAGSSSAYDTFKEVSDYIASDTSGAAAMLASIQNRLQVDADQTFTSAQLGYGLANLVKLGVAKQADFSAHVAAVGDLTVSYKTVYLTAKNS